MSAAWVVRSEWTKLRSVRSTWWTIVVSVVLTVGIGVAITAAAAAEDNSSGLARDVAARTMIGVILAQLALGTLAVLSMSGEYASGMIRTTLTVVPTRLPVLWAKVGVYAALVLPVATVTAVASFWLGQVAWRAGDRSGVSLGDPTVARIVLGSALYLTVAGICAIAIATIMRSTAGGITVVVGLFFVLPTVLQAMPSQIADTARFLPSNAGGALARIATSSSTLSPWTGFALLCGYAVVLLAAAAWRLQRSDV
jgi:ABC-2 type transport system permease protein